ncbi:MAG: cyclic nucleotide-binding domain-containing protein [Bryobacterales bacterium]
MKLTPMDPHAIAFPKLDEHQLATLAELAALETYEPGEALFRAGDRDYELFVIRSGEVAIVEDSSGEEKLVITHGPGDFTGDIDMLTGRGSGERRCRTACESTASPPRICAASWRKTRS